MTIILSGGGDPEVVMPIDQYFSSIINLRKTVLYIPIAMENHVFSYSECFAWFKRTYSAYDVINVECCTDLITVNLDSRYGAVYIGGGNTFKLLDRIQHSGFAPQIHAYLASGGILYGGSAGAIVCGKTIAPAIGADDNLVGLEDLYGLNLLDDHDVFCHYEPNKHDSYIDGLNGNYYLLYEESGLIFNGAHAARIGRPFVHKSSSFAS